MTTYIYLLFYILRENVMKNYAFSLQKISFFYLLRNIIILKKKQIKFKNKNKYNIYEFS